MAQEFITKVTYKDLRRVFALAKIQIQQTSHNAWEMGKYANLPIEQRKAMEAQMAVCNEMEKWLQGVEDKIENITEW